jgi:hypothetical protein
MRLERIEEMVRLSFEMFGRRGLRFRVRVVCLVK